MHVFEWRGGEYHPLGALFTEMDEAKKGINSSDRL